MIVKLIRQRAFAALLIGGVIGTLPQLIAVFPFGSRFEGLQGLTSYLLIPGVLVGLILNGWSVHDPDFAIILIASAMFYAICVYAMLSLLAGRTQIRSGPKDFKE